jgi:hypothetical protein
MMMMVQMKSSLLEDEQSVRKVHAAFIHAHGTFPPVPPPSSWLFIGEARSFLPRIFYFSIVLILAKIPLLASTILIAICNTAAASDIGLELGAAGRRQ